MIGADGEEPGIFALAPGMGCSGSSKAGDLGKPSFEILEQMLVALRLVERRKGMHMREIPR